MANLEKCADHFLGQNPGTCGVCSADTKRREKNQRDYIKKYGPLTPMSKPTKTCCKKCNLSIYTACNFMVYSPERKEGIVFCKCHAPKKEKECCDSCKYQILGEHAKEITCTCQCHEAGKDKKAILDELWTDDGKWKYVYLATPDIGKIIKLARREGIILDDLAVFEKPPFPEQKEECKHDFILVCCGENFGHANEHSPMQCRKCGEKENKESKSSPSPLQDWEARLNAIPFDHSDPNGWKKIKELISSELQNQKDSLLKEIREKIEGMKMEMPEHPCAVSDCNHFSQIFYTNQALTDLLEDL